MRVDCGAGVGRVTHELLLHFFQEVDLLEPSQPLLECAKKNLSKKKLPGVPAGHSAVNFYCAGLQEHAFEPGRWVAIRGSGGVSSSGGAEVVTY
jgi:protein N-terminal methyltransferase